MLGKPLRFSITPISFTKLSTISSKYGTDIAKEATNSHEPDSNLSGFTFSEKAEADSRCDLLNNEIGISLGSQNKKSSMKHLTGQVLDIFHSEGLWMSSQDENGNWIVSRQKMSDADYQKAIQPSAGNNSCRQPHAPYCSLRRYSGQ
jgi:hypothetical protein